MSPAPAHRVITADRYQVPRPFRSFAVRCEEPRLATQARAPWGRVRLWHGGLLDAVACAALAAAGRAEVAIDDDADIGHAQSSFEALSALAPGASGLRDRLMAALQYSLVLGSAAAPYGEALDQRIDHLAARGAGFHNDVSRHWPRCLFWLLALAVEDVEFVQPHAGLRLALAPGDLLLFDPSMAHGLCRPGDGQAVAASFDDLHGRVGAVAAPPGRQQFLTGEIPLTDAHWAAQGCPWLPVDHHASQGALDLMVAEFDERSGAIKRLRDMAGCMRSSTSPDDEISA
jgi:hypothetical protein